MLYALVAVFFLIQFVPNELPENNSDRSNDIVEITKAPDHVKLILRKACYDCHSNQTIYPWYSYVAPSSWLVAKDTRLGREELNFSEWGALSKRKKIRSLGDVAEEVEERKMPLSIYTLVHWDAVLSDQEIDDVTKWTKTLSDSILNGD